MIQKGLADHSARLGPEFFGGKVGKDVSESVLCFTLFREILELQTLVFHGSSFIFRSNSGFLSEKQRNAA